MVRDFCRSGGEFVTKLYGLYLICPQSLEVASSLGDLSIFPRLSDQVAKGHLKFPDLVAQECLRYSSDSAHSIWISGAKNSMRNAVVSWAAIQHIQDSVPQIDDLSRAEEQANAQLAALAWERAAAGVETCVVTDDEVSTPLRTLLKDACNLLRVPTLSFQDYFPIHLQ